MNKEQAFEMIEQAKVRVLTDEEVAQIGEWAKAELVTNPPGPASQVEASTHPVVEWITTYTKGTRPTEHFSANFKKVKRVVMPSVVAVFAPTGTK